MLLAWWGDAERPLCVITRPRFPWGQLAGAAVVLLGVAVTLLPRLLGLNQHSNSHSTAVSSTATPGRTLFELLYIVMAVPRATNKVPCSQWLCVCVCVQPCVLCLCRAGVEGEVVEQQSH